MGPGDEINAMGAPMVRNQGMGANDAMLQHRRFVGLPIDKEEKIDPTLVELRVNVLRATGRLIILDSAEDMGKESQ